MNGLAWPLVKMKEDAATIKALRETLEACREAFALYAGHKLDCVRYSPRRYGSLGSLECDCGFADTCARLTAADAALKGDEE